MDQTDNENPVKAPLCLSQKTAKERGYALFVQIGNPAIKYYRLIKALRQPFVEAGFSGFSEFSGLLCLFGDAVEYAIDEAAGIARAEAFG
jgi:hypothetical protein